MEHQRAGPGPGWVTLRGDTQASRLARGWQEQKMQEQAWTLDKPSQGRRELPRPPEAWVLKVTLETYECQGHIHRPGRGRVSSRVSVCSGCCNEHHSWALIKSRSLLATVLEAGSQDQGARRVGAWPGPPPGSQQLSPRCVLTWRKGPEVPVGFLV